MNVYDFDKTIYKGDSTIDFYLYCLFKHPRIVKYIFRQIRGILLWYFHRIDDAEMKSRFFSFLSEIDVPAYVSAFWEKNYIKIQKWYLLGKEKSDVIISASPEFLLAPVCKTLGVSDPIATYIDPHTGRVVGKNCKGKEKADRFFICYPGESIACFYSDSLTDQPLASLAERAFLVKKGKISEWKIF